jgi:uncharacterized protein YkwD
LTRGARKTAKIAEVAIALALSIWAVLAINELVAKGAVARGRSAKAPATRARLAKAWRAARRTPGAGPWAGPAKSWHVSASEVIAWRMNRRRARARWTFCPGANARPNQANAAAIGATTLCLVNRMRAAHHMRGLRANHELRAVAANQVKYMVRLNYFADDRPSGKTPLALIAATRYGARARRLSTGETIGWGTGVCSTPAEMVAAWMRSPGHRAIILTGAFSDAGVAVTSAVPSALGVGRPGATYALELGAHGF